MLSHEDGIASLVRLERAEIFFVKGDVTTGPAKGVEKLYIM